MIFLSFAIIFFLRGCVIVHVPIRRHKTNSIVWPIESTQNFYQLIKHLTNVLWEIFYSLAEDLNVILYTISFHLVKFNHHKHTLTNYVLPAVKTTFQRVVCDTVLRYIYHMKHISILVPETAVIEAIADP